MGSGSSRDPERFVVHPRIRGSYRFRPTDIVYSYIEDGTGLFWVDAVRTVPEEWRSRRDWIELTVLDYLLHYNFRGSNRFQEEENLQFLAAYLDRYPEIRGEFREDILVPSGWED